MPLITVFSLSFAFVIELVGKKILKNKFGNLKTKPIYKVVQI